MKVFIITAAILLTGCGNRITSLPVTPGTLQAPEYTMTVEETSIPAEYEAYPEITKAMDGICFFATVTTESAENNTIFYNEIYVTGLYGEETPRRIEKTPEYLDASDLRKDSDGQLIFTVLSRTEDGSKWFITEYDANGDKRCRTEIKTEISENRSGLNIWRFGDGTYAVLSVENLYLVSGNGETETVISCPGEDFRTGVLIEDTLYLAYTRDLYATFVLGCPDADTKEITEKTTLPEDIRKCAAAEDGSVLAICDKGMYRVSGADTSVEKIVDMQALYLFAENISSIEVRDKEITMLYREVTNAGSRMVMRHLTRK